jgi:hypothetical protein
MLWSILRNVYANIPPSNVVERTFSIFRNFWFLPVNSTHGAGADIENKRRLEDPVFLDRFAYKVYSQNGEDGIISEIFKRIGTTNKTFVEFGVQDGLESNGHYLLFNGWRGLWMDGNKKALKRLKSHFARPIGDGRLTALNAFITAENINTLIGEDGGITGEIDLLSIDIDGNDYWVWKAITVIRPRVVIIEYNAKFPPPCEWVIEYAPSYVWEGADKQGASLKSYELLGRELGYTLVATDLSGTNAFFVKDALCHDLFPQPATAENHYRPMRIDRRWLSGGHRTKTYIGT